MFSFLHFHEKGTRIHGRVYEKYFDRFNHQLVEGHGYVIQTATLGDNLGTFKYTDSKFKMLFNYNTKVKESFDFNGPLNGFQFTDFQSILNQTCTQSTFFG